ncbi:homeobox even-skipped homolog protein 2-like [Cydia strobilella]|uniref:homeobox even-skipped homolog protein 2-like n=1 Tax=Cydia strobilella TaxID=1100964 RepID=UPI0030076E9B
MTRRKRIISAEAGCGAGAGGGVGGGAGAGAGGAGCADSFSRSVARYALRFTAALLSVLAITDQMVRDTNANKLLNISSRLNFNTYYAKQLEKFWSDDKMLDGDKAAS